MQNKNDEYIEDLETRLEDAEVMLDRVRTYMEDVRALGTAGKAEGMKNDNQILFLHGGAAVDIATDGLSILNGQKLTSLSEMAALEKEKSSTWLPFGSDKSSLYESRSFL